jgi:hypothetical protein
VLVACSPVLVFIQCCCLFLKIQRAVMAAETPPGPTEVGPPERTRQTVREGLNDVWVGGR